MTSPEPSKEPRRESPFTVIDDQQIVTTRAWREVPKVKREERAERPSVLGKCTDSAVAGAAGAIVMSARRKLGMIH